MKLIRTFSLAILLACALSSADTPTNPGFLKGGTDGTRIGNISDSLKVNIMNPVPIQSVLVVNQPSPVPTQSVFVVNQPIPSPTITVTGTVNAIVASPLPVVEVSPVMIGNWPTPSPTITVLVANPDPIPSPTITVLVASPIPSQTVTVSNPDTNYALETGGNLANIYSKLVSIITSLGNPFQAGGSIGNSSFGISGTLPGFASTPTFNLGTLNGAATDAQLVTVNSTLGTLFQAGQSIGNTSFGISGTLPAFGSPPTFNLGTLNGAATAANQAAANSSLATIVTQTAGLAQESGGNLAGINSKLSTTSNGLKVDNSGVTQPISVVSLPLPSGAATSANQVNGSQVTQVSTLPPIPSGTNAVGYLSGRGTVGAPYVHDYSVGNLLTSAFTTLVSSTASAVNEIGIFDNSGGVYYLSYAASCGALSSASNAIVVTPGGGGFDFAIPSGQCVGVEAITSSITSGNVYMTFYK